MNIRHAWIGIGSGILATALAVSSARAQATTLRYEVAFRGHPTTTQTVSLVRSPGLTTISTSFELDIPVFTAIHRYAETLSATFRDDGTIERFESRRSNGAFPTLVTGELRDDGRLEVVRSSPEGTNSSFIAREDYDFHSLIFYGTPPSAFLPTNQPSRVLSIAEGRVVPIPIQVITESDTFERQHLVSTHLVWTDGVYTSHTWHPERFSNLPRRFIRQTADGEFTFTLLR